MTVVVAGLPEATPAGPLVAVGVSGALGTGIAYILNYSIIRDDRVDRRLPHARRLDRGRRRRVA